MTRRVLSKAIASTWKIKPVMLNSSSPYDAVATPNEIMTTIAVSVVDNCFRPNENEMINTATGVNAFSIWMNGTLRCRYAMLLRIRLAENSTPIGRIFRYQRSIVMSTLASPSSKFVYRASKRVPTAAKAMWNVVRNTGYGKWRFTRRYLLYTMTPLLNAIQIAMMIDGCNTRLLGRCECTAGCGRPDSPFVSCSSFSAARCACTPVLVGWDMRTEGDKGNAGEMCGGKTVCPRGRSARFVHDRWPRANDESDKTGRTHMCVT